MNLFIIAVSISFFVFLLHNTDFLLEYAKLFGSRRFDGYEEWKKTNQEYYWPVYLRLNWKGGRVVNYLGALIRCPICLITVLSLITAQYFLYVGGLGALFYFVLVILYKTVNKLL